MSTISVNYNIRTYVIFPQSHKRETDLLAHPGTVTHDSIHLDEQILRHKKESDS